MPTKTKIDECAACGGIKGHTETRNVAQLFRDEEFNVQTPVSVCDDCKFEFLNSHQLEELRRRTADAYRKKHGLLQSHEIVSRRTQLQLTQEQFAHRLNVGVASVKRWETWLVQDKRNDQIIREFTDRELLVRRVSEVLRNAPQTQRALFACDQIVEGEAKIHQGMIELLEQFKTASNPWCRFLISNDDVHYVTSVVQNPPYGVARWCASLAEAQSVSAARSDAPCVMFGQAPVKQGGFVTIRTGTRRIEEQPRRLFVDQNVVASAA